MAQNQTTHFEHHRREIQLTRQRFRVVILALFVGLSVTVGLQYMGSFAAGTPEIASGIAGKCLDDRGSVTTDRNPVDIWDCNGTSAQQWVKTGSLVKVFGKCLDVIGQGTVNGTKLELFTCNGGTNQSWTFTAGQMVGVGSGKCLDDPSSTTTNGTQLQIFTCNGTAAQQWAPATYTPPAPPPTPNPTPAPTPNPTPAPTPGHTPAPTPIQQTPTPNPGGGGGSSGGGSGGSSGGSSGSGGSAGSSAGAGSGGSGATGTDPAGGGTGAGTSTPDAPGGFSALASGSNAVIDLSWTASSDSAGIASYQLERSEDQSLWNVVSSTIVDTGYSDTTVDFGVHYYYRIKAVDNAGVASDYSLADATTPDFTGNAGSDSPTSYTSDDHIASVLLPTGAVDSSADCSVSSDPSHTFSNTTRRVVAGPFALVCKDATGNVVQAFNKPLAWSFNLNGKLKGLSDPLAYSTDTTNALTPIKGATFNSVHSTLAFTSTTPNSVLVMAAVTPGVPWSALVALLLAIGAIGGVVVLILRKKQKANYDDYLRSKYYNL